MTVVTHTLAHVLLYTASKGFELFYGSTWHSFMSKATGLPSLSSSKPQTHLQVQTVVYTHILSSALLFTYFLNLHSSFLLF